MYPAHLYQTSNLSKEPIRERFSIAAQPKPKEEPDLKLWIDQFWKCIHVFGRVYQPTDKEIKQSFSCFFQSLSGILPSKMMRGMMKDFIAMTPTIQKALLEHKSLTSFFTVHRPLYNVLISKPGEFFTFCLEDGDSLFAWTFLFHSYFNMVFGLPLESFHSLRLVYSPEKIHKETWANPLWYMMHTCAYYSRQEQNCNMCFKAFMSCLRYAIPCPKCRNHLSGNLEQIDIDKFLYIPEGIFDYTVRLHNSVNEQLGRPILSVEDARSIYDPFNQPLVRQNMSVARFISQ
jgi:Erv1 / Alr family